MRLDLFYEVGGPSLLLKGRDLPRELQGKGCLSIFKGLV